MQEPAASVERKPHARMDLTQGPISRTLLLFLARVGLERTAIAQRFN